MIGQKGLQYSLLSQVTQWEMQARMKPEAEQGRRTCVCCAAVNRMDMYRPHEIFHQADVSLMYWRQANLSPHGAYGFAVNASYRVTTAWPCRSATVQGESGSGPIEALAVVNIGQRPTYGDSPAISIEAHVLHKFQQDFYGKNMRLDLQGYIRCS